MKFVSISTLGLMFTALSICGCHHEGVAYDHDSGLEPTAETVDQSIALDYPVRLTYMGAHGRTQKDRGKMKKEDDHYLFFPRIKGYTTYATDGVKLELSQIRKISIIDKEGLQSADLLTPIVIAGLALTVLYVTFSGPELGPVHF